jgi:3-oxoacyl-ACP reductase-like protein
VRGVLAVATAGCGGEAQPETATGPAMTAGPAQASAVSEAGSSLKDEQIVPRHADTVEALVSWERALRAQQIHHQSEADDFGTWRTKVVQCLHNLHGLSYEAIAEQLGGVTRAQVEYLAKGRKR